MPQQRGDASRPDFEIWATRLPRRWRVIILALSPLTHFDTNAVLDLKNAIQGLRRHGRRLVLSGITPRQYRLLMDAQIDNIMSVENICPDLEFAVARGIDLVHQSQPEVPVALAAFAKRLLGLRRRNQAVPAIKGCSPKSFHAIRPCPKPQATV